MVFYNEIDPFAAEWLRQLIRGGHIADGIVDERSIVEIEPNELRGYTQCHFFAGIGGWSYALRLAGVPDHASVWTGSCPCQPFSSAGKQRAADDERHLWPAFFRLIRECRPGVVFGEQVAGHAGYAWWDAVATDLESEDYAVAAADLGAHSVGAPHIRQRLYWVAHANNERRFLSERHTEAQPRGPTHGPAEQRHDVAGCGEICGLGDAISAGLERHRTDQAASGWDGTSRSVTEAGDFGGVADAQHDDRRADEQRWGPQERSSDGWDLEGFGRASAASPTDDFWRDADWLFCRDGKFRPVEPGTFPLADGVSAPVGRLRGYGNAIVPQVAAAFITVFSEQFSETAVRPSMSSAQGIDSNGVADGNRTRDTRSHNSEPNQGNTTA